MNAYQPVESLRQDLAEKGVKYAMASYVDIHGAIKGKFVPLNHLDRMMKGSEPVSYTHLTLPTILLV